MGVQLCCLIDPLLQVVNLGVKDGASGLAVLSLGWLVPAGWLEGNWLLSSSFELACLN